MCSEPEAGEQGEHRPGSGLPCARGHSGLPEAGPLCPGGRLTQQRRVSPRVSGCGPVRRGSEGSLRTPPARAPALTQAQQDRAHLGQAAPGSGRGALGRAPGEAGAQQPRVHELAAESLGLGHQLLVGGRAVKGVHELRGEDRGAPQHLHVGDAGGGRGTCGQTALSPGRRAERSAPRRTAGAPGEPPGRAAAAVAVRSCAPNL